jgi:hypothetical protein
MSGAWFGGVNDARDSMISLAKLHDEGRVESVSMQLVVTRVAETLKREIEIRPSSNNLREALSFYKFFEANHERNPGTSGVVLHKAIDLLSERKQV